MENQQLEWKETWRDEYLKWICGFANAQGGTFVIGKNDKGETVGVKNAEKLLEDLPNKIRATMGVVADVNLRKDNGLNIIEILVPAYPNTISYHGKYYFRSGSTNQELSGYALDSLLLEKYGRTYDSMPVPHITFGDFWHDAFDIFRKKAVASKRLTTEEVAVSDKELLQSLSLTANDYLLLAAVLVFHQTPQQWRPGAYVKIGYFTDDAEILYQDELYGSLVGLADKVVDTIFTKYFIGRIRYEGLQRIDDYPMPRIALREAVLNSLVHRDYSTGSPVQIRIYDNRVTIANDCRLPEGTTLSALINAHKSVSINPLVAGAIFRSGQIEAWGRGIERIIKLCVADNLQEPEFIITPRTFTICFHIRENRLDAVETSSAANNDGGVKDGNKDGIKDGINEMQIIILEVMDKTPEITIKSLSEILKINIRNTEKNIKALKNKGLIERVGNSKTGYWKISACNHLKVGDDFGDNAGDVDNEVENKSEVAINEGESCFTDTINESNKEKDAGISDSVNFVIEDENCGINVVKDSVKNENFGVNFGVKDENFVFKGGLKEDNFVLNRTQEIIITLIMENPNINIQEIANKMNFTKRNIEYNIKALKDKGLIERVGSDKTGHWKIKDYE